MSSFEQKRNLSLKKNNFSPKDDGIDFVPPRALSRKLDWIEGDHGVVIDNDVRARLQAANMKGKLGKALSYIMNMVHSGVIHIDNDSVSRFQKGGDNE